MFYCIYKITNKIDGKIYIGSHKTENLDDTYMGSGKYLKYAQEKYGIENFTKEILFVFDTPEQMYAKEAEIVNEEFIATENTYNLKVGGFGGWDLVNANKLGVPNIHRHFELLKTDDEYKERYSKSLSIRNRKMIDSGVKPFGGFTHGFKNKKHSPQTIEKLKKSKNVGENNPQHGTCWINDSTCAKKIKKEELEFWLNSGWKQGRKF